MANKNTIARIERAAKFLATPTAQDAKGYLDKPLETALKILDQFADGKPHNYQKISEATGIHPTTVQQVVNALDRGGYPLQFTFGAVRKTTGRKLVAIHKGKDREEQ